MITNSFEDSVVVSLYSDTTIVDPLQQLETDKDLVLSKLGRDKDEFLSWLSTVNIKCVSTLKLETLELLVSCWLACANKYVYESLDSCYR